MVGVVSLRTWSLAICLTALISIGLVGCGSNKKTEAKSSQPAKSAATQPQTRATSGGSGRSSDVAAVDVSDMPAKSYSAPKPVAAKSKPKPAPTPRASSGGVSVDPGLHDYRQRYRIRGRLRSIGSDTMDKVMQYWEAGFTKYHPQLRVFHEGKGSSTAPPALAEGLSDFGPMSRQVKDKEITLIENAVGYAPTQIPVALDALAVYVHPENPIIQKGLTFAQLDAIFSSTRKLGHSSDITTWGDVGLTGEWADAEINVYSRNKASGTYGFFKDKVLGKGDYKTSNRELVGSEEVVSSVANDKFGIGYSGIGYKTDSVAVIPLAKTVGQTKYPPKPSHAYSGQYPLARYLYLTILHKPGTKLGPLQEEFLRYALSEEGQALVIKDGYFPLSADIVTVEMTKLGIKP